MPLLKMNDHGQPLERAEECKCQKCSALRHLLPEDWSIVSFYASVQDQVNNLTPMGTEDGKMWLAPNLPAWVAAADLYGVPAQARASLIDDARYLHEGISGRVHVPGVHGMPVEELAALEVPNG